MKLLFPPAEVINVASVNFSGIPPKFRRLRLEIEGASNELFDGNAQLGLRFATDPAGTAFDTGNNYTSGITWAVAPTVPGAPPATSVPQYLAYHGGGAGGYSMIYLTIDDMCNPQFGIAGHVIIKTKTSILNGGVGGWSGNIHQRIESHLSRDDAAGNLITEDGIGVYLGAFAPITGIQILCSAGENLNGYFELWGETPFHD